MKMSKKIVFWWNLIAMPLCIVGAVVREQYELASVWAIAFGWFLIALITEKKAEFYRRKKFETELLMLSIYGIMKLHLEEAKKECEDEETYGKN